MPSGLDRGTYQDEGQRSFTKAPSELTAWDYFQRGLYEHWKFTLAANKRAQEFFDFMGQSEAAIAAFKTAGAMFPTLGWEVVYFCRVALCYLHASAYEEAVERARKAIGEDPRNPHAYVTLSASLAHLGQLAEARAALAKGETIDPDFVLNWY